MGKGAGKGTGGGKGKGHGKGAFMDIFNEMEEAVKGIACCVCLMLVAGPVCLLMGLSYIGDSTTDSRGMAIASFQTVVSDWSDTDRALFDNHAFSIKLPSEVVARPLRKFEDGDPLQEAAVADLGTKSVDGDTSWATWTPLFYKAQVTVPSVASLGQARGSGTPIELHDDTAGAAALWNDYADLVGCAPVSVDVTPCSDTCTSTSRRRSRSSGNSCTTCSSKCRGQGGEMQTGTHACVRSLTLTEVNLAASGSGASWSFDGIAYTLPAHDTTDTSFHGRGSHNPRAGGTYTSAPGACPPAPPTVEVPLTIRSKSDPVVKAAETTNYELTSSGAFDFGAWKTTAVVVSLCCFVPSLSGQTIEVCYFLLQGTRRPRTPRLAPHW
jgi:hypothetical protein